MKSMKKLFGFVGVSCLAFASACAAEDPAELAAPPAGPEAPYFSAVSESPEAVGSVDGDEGELPAPDDRSEKAGCSHIQWCNEPGYWGTICIWDACDFETARQECVRDANYVCGRIVRPEQLRL